MEACLPKSEKERLAAIEPYQILDTLPEGQFDEITQVPAHIYGESSLLSSGPFDGRRPWAKYNSSMS
jgi:hypothetical protein